MEHYAGIDVSLESSSICVVDGGGRIVREAKVSSEPDALFAWFRGLGFDVARSGLEAGIEMGLKTLPPEYRRSITFDRGTEFTGHAMLKARLGLQSYFCAPQAPWKKGTVENTNGRLRRFMPMETDLATKTDAELTALAHHMNAIPRKCLEFRTPAEVLALWMTGHAADPIIDNAPSHFGSDSQCPIELSASSRIEMSFFPHGFGPVRLGVGMGLVLVNERDLRRVGVLAEAGLVASVVARLQDA